MKRDSQETLRLCQPYAPTRSKSLFLDREGNENEYEPKYLRKISNFLKKMNMIEEQTELPLARDLYGGIEKTLLSSNFWLEDNEYADFKNIRGYGGVLQTDAAHAMSLALQDYFRSLKIPVTVVAMTIDPDEISDKNKAYQTNKNPNHFVAGAAAGLSDTGRLQLLLYSVESKENFDPTLVNSNRMAQQISKVIRHEFMHDRQYTSLAKAKGITRAAAKKMFEDWGLIPKEGATRDQYLSSHIEIDAFGHEFAEELVQNFDLDDAEILVSTANQKEIEKLAKEIDMSDNLKEYYLEYPKERFTNRLQKKIRKYLKAFRDNKVYESTYLIESVLTKLTEELTKTDKKEIEKIARKQAKKEIERVVGTSLEKTIQKEVEKTLKNKATKNELANITKAVMKKLYKDLAMKPQILDRIKI